MINLVVRDGHEIDFDEEKVERFATTVRVIILFVVNLSLLGFVFGF